MGTDGTARHGNGRNGRNGEKREPTGGTVHNDFRGAHFTHSQVQGSGITNVTRTARWRAYLVGGLAATVAVLVVVITWLHGEVSSRDANAGAGGVASSAPVLSPSPTPPSPPASAPLDRRAVDRAFREYLDALVSHDMTALRRATCPRLRATLLGFALNNYYVARWKVLPYSIPDATDRFSVDVLITQRDPGTGQLAGDVTYQWMAERDTDGNYWICGWLNER
ncbi:hypothetical protein ACFWP2_29980 [Kitasatospora sp. NPDC058444]|uniref:hypothetical protein n=1 Tax=Kitasatospora sp. NPDC058444 TaxID=3346504 RepID=UPI00365259DC